MSPTTLFQFHEFFQSIEGTTNLGETVQTDSISAESVRKEKNNAMLSKRSQLLLILVITVTIRILIDYYRRE